MVLEPTEPTGDNMDHPTIFDLQGGELARAPSRSLFDYMVRVMGPTPRNDRK